jgi:hypothetical protein
MPGYGGSYGGSYGGEYSSGSEGYSPYGASGSYPGMSGSYGASSYDAGGYNPYGGSYGSSEASYGSYGSSEMGGYSPYGMGSGGMGMSMGGSSMYGGGARMAGPPAEYKLFRFYDFQVEPGKKYKYRVKLFLIDPNRPREPQLAPLPAYLDDEALTRVKKVEAADAQAPATNGIPQRTFWVETDWSEWSEVASIPPQYRMLAGAATPERTTPNRESGQEVLVPEPGSETEANVLALVWDHAKAADMPGQLTAVRGSVLNFTADANVLHPVNLQVFTLPNYNFRTDVMVLDVRGGRDLPTNNRAEIDLKSPGELLLVDMEGNLMVHNELDDIRDYNNNIFKEPEKPKTPAPEAGSESYYPGYGAPSGRPSRGRRGSGS